MCKGTRFAKLNMEIRVVVCIMVVDFCIKFHVIYIYFYIAYYYKYLRGRHWKYVRNFRVQELKSTRWLYNTGNLGLQFMC